MLIVAIVNHNENNPFVAKTVREVYSLANPDRDDRVDIFVTQTDDPDTARLLYRAVDTRIIGTIDCYDRSVSQIEYQLRTAENRLEMMEIGL